MISNLQKSHLFWKEFNISELQKELDKEAEEVTKRQDESEISRTNLVELSKRFKKDTPEEVRKQVGPLLKCFQKEIDSLIKRSKSGESSFLNLYKKFLSMPDPINLVEFSLEQQKKLSKYHELEVTNKQMKERLDEYNAEFADVKNQEVTVKNLREKIKEMEEKIESQAEMIANEREKEFIKNFREKENKMVDENITLAKKLGEVEARCINLQSSYEVCQTELFDLKSKHDEVIVSKNYENEIIISDLERANEKILALEKLIEHLQANAILDNQANSPSNQQLQREQVMDALKRANLEVELATKEKEVSQLVNEVQNLQQIIKKTRDSGSNLVGKLEKELEIKTEKISNLEAKLTFQSDYDEIKKELSILKSIEFPFFEQKTNELKKTDFHTIKPQVTLEVLLVEKNKILQSEKASVNLQLARLQEDIKVVTKKNKELEILSEDQKKLISQLEEDLRNVNSLSLMFRGDAEGEDGSLGNSTSQSEVMATIVKEASKSTSLSSVNMEAMKSATTSLLPIIQNQRERFRTRVQELEAITIQQNQQTKILQNEMDQLRGDNLKLYEKIKFLQGYNQHSRNKINTEDVENKYNSQYNEKLNPFNYFNKTERIKRYMNLKPYDKITLGMGKFIMSNKIARTVVFFYTLLLHLLVFMVLYKLAYTASCQRDSAAEDWHKKFADHMASHHPEEK